MVGKIPWLKCMGVCKRGRSLGPCNVQEVGERFQSPCLYVGGGGGGEVEIQGPYI